MDNIFPSMQLPQEITYEFLGTFARCEYALKSVGYARSKGSSVEANWDQYSKDINWHFLRIKDETLRSAVRYLLESPPRKQTLHNGIVNWLDSPPNPALKKTERALLMVRRVRNNLFHGAKIWSPHFDNRERDLRLVTDALVILKYSIEVDSNVRDAFNFGVF